MKKRKATSEESGGERKRPASAFAQRHLARQQQQVEEKREEEVAVVVSEQVQQENTTENAPDLDTRVSMTGAEEDNEIAEIQSEGVGEEEGVGIDEGPIMRLGPGRSLKSDQSDGGVKRQQQRVHVEPQWWCQSNWRLTTHTCVQTTVNGEKAVIVVLEPNEQITFCGYAEIAVLSGEVSIFGFRATPAPIFRPLYSPRSSSLLSILAPSQPANQGSLRDLKTACDWLGGEAAEVAGQVGTTNQNRAAAVIVLKAPSNKNSRSAKSVCALKMFRHIFRLDTDPDSNRGNNPPPMHIPHFHPVLEPVMGVRSFSAPDQWQGIAYTLTSFEGVPRVVMCGGKDTGKSTMGRYLLNSLLGRYPTVAHIECDVGQGEFTPQGLVSLTLRTAPIFGPPAFHLATPHRSYFIGDTTPKCHPTYYLQCIRALLHEYATNENFRGVPLIVNTHGWIKGIGVHMVEAVCALATPTHVVQFLSEDSPTSLSFDPITPAAIASAQEEDPLGIFGSGPPSPPSEHQLLIVDVPPPSNLTISGRYTATDHRLMALASYFCTQTPIVAQGTVALPFKDVALCVLYEEVAWSQILYAFNACIVGLVGSQTQPLRADPEDMEYAGIMAPGYLPSMPVAPCHGLGIMRAIDTAQGLLHVITPVTDSQLDAVNVLVRGPMEIPPVLTEGASTTTAPYTSEAVGSDAAGGSARRSRGNIMRRRLQQ